MQRQWFVILQNLPAAGRAWDVDVPKKLLQDSEFGEVDVVSGLCADVHWSMLLERQANLFHMTGQWQAEMPRHCSRCNAAFNWQVTGQTERQFQLGLESADDESDSLCEFVAAPGEVNLVDVLLEDIWLAWKADVICSETCRGLCQGCGNNLNTSACKCERDESDHPFAALRNIKLDG